MTDKPDHETVTKTARSIIANPSAPRSFSSIEDLARAYLDATEWREINDATPRDCLLQFYAPPREGLPALQGVMEWHPDAGFCVDELRYPTHYLPLPQPPKVMK